MERDLIIALLRLGTGFDIDLFATLSIGQGEDGTFTVEYDPDGDWITQEEWQFDDVEKAVDFFIAKRHELELGYDHEYGVEFYREKAGVKPEE